MAHQNWIEKFGLPTHEEAATLRLCYGIGDTTADEWTVIARHIVPDHHLQSGYRAIHRDGFWRIVDGDGDEIRLVVFDKKANPCLGMKTARTL
jgi:hypothetical protein